MMHLRDDDSVAQKLPSKFDYYMDESDSVIVVVRRQDGSFVTAFSARGNEGDPVGASPSVPTGPR